MRTLIRWPRDLGARSRPKEMLPVAATVLWPVSRYDPSQLDFYSHFVLVSISFSLSHPVFCALSWLRLFLSALCRASYPNTQRHVSLESAHYSRADDQRLQSTEMNVLWCVVGCCCVYCGTDMLFLWRFSVNQSLLRVVLLYPICNWCSS